MAIKFIEITYEKLNNNKTNNARVEIAVDSAADLVTAHKGINFTQGSIAWDISTDDFYGLNSNGEWLKQGGGGGSATLIEKTITANGTYLPAEDEATAYSKVVVDVAANFEYIRFPIPKAATNTYSTDNILLTSSDNNYILPYGPDISLSGSSYDAYLSTPANNINCTNIESGRIVFTPGENCQFVWDSGTPISVVGDTITPLDGKVYYLTKYRDSSSGSLVHEVTKTDRNFFYNVVS